MRISGDQDSIGRVNLGPYQSSDSPARGYRLVYDSTSDQPLSLKAVDQEKSRTIASTSQVPRLADGEFHRLEWTRDPGGEMTVVVYGELALTVLDRSLRENFSGFLLINAGGEWQIDEVTIRSIDQVGSIIEFSRSGAFEHLAAPQSQRFFIGGIGTMIAARTATALALVLAIPAVTSAQETIDLPPKVIEGFYITLDDVRARIDEVYDALAGAAGDPISKDDFIETKLPDKVVPEDADRELLQRLFGVLDINGNGELTRAEWNERIEGDLTFADENEDGKITLKELSNARENIGIGDALGMIF